MGKRYDPETARKVCGALKQRLGSSLEELLAEIEKELGLIKTAELTITYDAAIEPLEQDGKRFVKVWVIDSTRNENDWLVTPDAKTKALKSLLGKPLTGPPMAGHKSGRTVGHFVDYETNGSVVGLAEITDNYAWNQIRNGAWRWVSPAISAKAERSWHGVAVVTDFDFDHVAFVEHPAYGPKAKALTTCEGSPDACGFSRSLTAEIMNMKRNAQTDCMKRFLNPDGTFRDGFDGCVRAMQTCKGLPEENARRLCAFIGRQTGKIGSIEEFEAALEKAAAELSISLSHSSTLGEPDKGINSNLAAGPAKTGEVREPNKCRECQYTMEDKIKELEAELKTAQKENEELRRKIPSELETQVKTMKAENESLKTRLATIEEEKHLTLVGEVVDLKIKASLIEEKDRSAEVEKLRKLSAEALSQMKSDFSTIVMKPRTASWGTPQAKYTAEQTRGGIEEIREEIFGYRRNEKGERVN